MADKNKPFEHIIRERWCKGCDVCVAFCPKKVLALQNGKVVVVNPEDCIGCRLCELRCPDIAIDVQDKSKKNDANQGMPVSPEAR